MLVGLSAYIHYTIEKRRENKYFLFYQMKNESLLKYSSEKFVVVWNLGREKIQSEIFDKKIVASPQVYSY